MRQRKHVALRAVPREANTRVAVLAGLCRRGIGSWALCSTQPWGPSSCHFFWADAVADQVGDLLVRL